MTQPCPKCGLPATLTVKPIADARLTRSHARLVCPNGHDVSAIPPRDDRMPR